MEVILREFVSNLGNTGEIVRVKPGYARNYLLPRGLAVLADRRNLKELEHQKRVTAEKAAKDKAAATSQAQRVSQVRLTFKARAGEEGKLFGSITNQDIERDLSAQGFNIERRKIRLEEPIKTVGEHQVSIHLGAGIDATITVVVEAEGQD